MTFDELGVMFRGRRVLHWRGETDSDGTHRVSIVLEPADAVSKREGVAAERKAVATGQAFPPSARAP